MSDPLNAQWICTEPDGCLCSGEDFSCDCRALHGDHFGICVDCLSTMVLIDCDTGKPVRSEAS